MRNETVRSGVWRVASAEDKPKHYKELIVWRKAMSLAKVYRITEKFPADERYDFADEASGSFNSIQHC
jgi:hypothetical protein